MSDQPAYPNPWHPDDEVYWNKTLRRWSFVKRFEVPKELEKLLWSGKLSQLCPYCGAVEPAGGFCGNCRRQVPPANYFKQKSLGADGKPRRGRPKKSEALDQIRGLAIAHT